MTAQSLHVYSYQSPFQTMSDNKGYF